MARCRPRHHLCSRSFSAAVKDLALEGTRPTLVMAWIGIDVHAWHKHIAYQVAVYALLMAVIEVELFLSHNRTNYPSPVLNIKSAKHEEFEASGMIQDGGASTNIGFFHEIVQEMDDIVRREVRTVMAITCCAGIRKLGSERLSCCVFSDSIAEALFELMDAANSLITLDKLHSLATEAVFEEDFLSYFGSRILPHKNVDDVEFWICLVQRQLCAAFHREIVASNMRILSNEVGENSLATLALFAYLGRETRLFLSRHGIRVLDKQTRDFARYFLCFWCRWLEDIVSASRVLLQLLGVRCPVHISGILNTIRISTPDGGLFAYIVDDQISDIAHQVA
ncbi:hypothetical protein SASPL_123198 [Salvia splendens]|uniref:Uncharacterized protein n=1 Tax=Salvia splendens TaxID=180675 RepID=A0A8X8XKY6_SALSN|nr:hypothetical protein SASPL_123198 [Salvia splendens]